MRDQADSDSGLQPSVIAGDTGNSPREALCSPGRWEHLQLPCWDIDWPEGLQLSLSAQCPPVRVPMWVS